MRFNVDTGFYCIPKVPTGKSSFFGKKKTIKPQAKLNVELRDPGKGLAGSVDQLPGTLLVREQLVPLIVLYRQTLASALQRKKGAKMSTEPLCDPFLVGFPSVLDMPVLAAHLKTKWDAYQKATKSSKAASERRAQFESVFLADIWPLMYNSAGTDEVPDFKAPAKGAAMPAVLSAEFVHEPFHTDQVSFDVLSGLEVLVA